MMSQSWLEQFEVRLELMEQRISTSEIPFREVMDLACHAFAALATDPSVDVFLIRPDTIEQFAEDGTTSPVESKVEALRQTLAGRLVSASQLIHTGTHQLADDVSLACRFTVTENVAPESSCEQGAAAIAAAIASMISRRLLTQYESRYSQQTNLVSVIAQLAGAASFSETASILAQDGASVLGNCRISVLGQQADRLKTHAVTGVSAPDGSSETVNKLERFALECCRQQKTSAWLTMDEVAEISEPLVSVMATSNVNHAQTIPFAENASAQAIEACLVIESFGVSLPDKYSVQQLVQAAAPIVSRHQRLQQPLWSRFFASRPVRQLMVAAVACLILAIVPADFEIEVDGQIQPTNWRRIYAPNHGTVESVSFNNEQQVAGNQTLLEMSNPDLELNLQTIQGKIQTTQARLATAETSRFTGSNPQASSDQQLLEVELENLNKDRQLIEAQNQELTVTAPFSGTVFLQDPQKELSIRPVQRGQLLCQIVAEDSQWQLELDVPEHLRQYLLSGDKAAKQSQSVRYFILAAPDDDWQTSLSSIDSAVQVRDGQLVCRATALVSELPDAHQRPGTSVSARIYCGRRSLGFVWFREVIEFWRQLKFAWL